MHKPEYTLEDLILNKDFISWVKNPDRYDGRKWLNWASINGDNHNLVEEAKDIILGLTDDNDAPEKDELAALWGRITATNNAFDKQTKSANKSARIFPLFGSWLKVAAVFTGLLLVGSVSYHLIAKNVEYGTENAQNKRIQLPDGSVIILNSNSSVSYSNNWDNDKPREVWLEGEGFFSVTHKVNSQKFIVHTKDLDVQVLGTKFNVNTRRGKTRVILKSGKVKLFYVKGEEEVLTMKPGEMVDFSRQEKKLAKTVVEASKYTAWVDHKLAFENASLQEVAIVLEENYGYKVTFGDEDLKKLTFTGTIDSGNTDLLFKILQKTFNISIMKQEENITITTSQSQFNKN